MFIVLSLLKRNLSKGFIVFITKMDKLRSIITNPKFQEGLCRLYRYSSSECRSNDGKHTPDVGRMRERDLIRTLTHFGIQTKQCEKKHSRADFFVDDNSVSVKHFTSKYNKGFKVTWTSDKDKADEDITNFIRNGLNDDMLIVKLDESKNRVTFFFMPVKTLNMLVRRHAEYRKFDPLKLFFLDPFKVFKKKGATNDRGVEFTSLFLREFYQNCEWSESFEGEFIGDPKDADERRDKMLAEMCA